MLTCIGGECEVRSKHAFIDKRKEEIALEPDNSVQMTRVSFQGKQYSSVGF